uniref:G-protein coupled receptors family 1 profile domain-containing protein n=1 Tax=Phocoena sinus TaxID=42100 RepID=A0A8C9CAJ5_PHOSS
RLSSGHSGDHSDLTFILVGLTDQSQLQIPLFFLFLLNCMVTVVGNLSLIHQICLNFHLHTPMYFLVFNLSFMDLYHSLVITPKLLMSFVSENIISFAGCMTLLAMAYDRCVSICKPLLYTVTMSPQVSSLLMFGSYVMVFAGAMVHTGHMVRLSFCDSSINNHYMCDIFPLLQLSCSSTDASELVDSIIVSTVVIICRFIIFVSYALIVSSILHISSAQGWSKALSTCGSHIITTFSDGSVGQGKFFLVFYTNVVPMLNLLIYSLRNKDVKLALKKTLKSKQHSCLQTSMFLLKNLDPFWKKEELFGLVTK